MTEVDTTSSHALISWRSIAGGFLITLFTMFGLLGLGLAFGGIGLDEDTSAKSAGIFSGVWFMASVIISLFVGSYFAARVSKFRTGRIGSAQGLIIAALFIGLFLYQTISAITSVGSMAGSVVGQAGGALASGVQKASQNSAIMNQVNLYAEDALADLNLRSDPGTVAKGVGTRLIQGDAEGAKNYLSRQAGITPAEADTRIAALKVRADKAIDDAKNATGTALKSAGWSIFLIVILGAISSIGGGALGSVANFRKPLVLDVDASASKNRHGTYA